jgi:outer membrane lipoprotein carrier protein
MNKARFKIRVAAVAMIGVALGVGLAAESIQAGDDVAAKPLAASATIHPGQNATKKNNGRVRKLLNALQLHYQKTRSFSAKFHQEIISASGAKRIRDGTVIYQKPGRMRWDFSAPESETIVSDGEALYDYQPDLNQVLKTPLKRAFTSSAPAALILGMGDLERDFEVSAPTHRPSGELASLVLVARGGGERVQMTVDPKSCDLAALSVTDQLGNTTRLIFSDVKNNPRLEPSLFEFRVPEGADVIEAPPAPR